MTSPYNTGVRQRGGDENDAFSKFARRIIAGFKRPGLAKKSKRSYNKRVRRTPIEDN